MAYILTDETTYDRAATYSGVAEICVFEFSLGPEQIPGTGWFANIVIDAFRNELEKNHGEMLELRVYRDAEPTWVTKFAIEAVVGTQQLQPAGAVRPQFIFALSWALIIKVLLLVVLPLIALAFAISALTTLWYGPANGGGGGIIPPFGDILGDIMPIILIVVVMAVMLPMMSRLGSGEK